MNFDDHYPPSNYPASPHASVGALPPDTANTGGNIGRPVGIMFALICLGLFCLIVVKRSRETGVVERLRLWTAYWLGRAGDVLFDWSERLEGAE